VAASDLLEYIEGVMQIVVSQIGGIGDDRIERFGARPRQEVVRNELDARVARHTGSKSRGSDRIELDGHLSAFRPLPVQLANEHAGTGGGIQRVVGTHASYPVAEETSDRWGCEELTEVAAVFQRHLVGIGPLRVIARDETSQRLGSELPSMLASLLFRPGPSHGNESFGFSRDRSRRLGSF